MGARHAGDNDSPHAPSRNNTPAHATHGVVPSLRRSAKDAGLLFPDGQRRQRTGGDTAAGNDIREIKRSAASHSRMTLPAVALSVPMCRPHGGLPQGYRLLLQAGLAQGMPGVH